MNYLINVLLLVLAVSVLVVSRLLPHAPNFTPVLALMILAGMSFQRGWMALILGLAAVFLTDMTLGFYAGFEWVYLGYALTIAAARFSRNSERSTVWRAGFAGVSGNLVFFFISNFGVWWSAGIYPRTFNGLVTCYLAGLPFLWPTLLSTAVYGGLFMLIGLGLKKAQPALFQRFSSAV